MRFEMLINGEWTDAHHDSDYAPSTYQALNSYFALLGMTWTKAYPYLFHRLLQCRSIVCNGSFLLE